MELLGFHPQMKTTWPAARVRWKPDGGSEEGAPRGGLEQSPSVLSCPLRPSLASATCRGLFVTRCLSRAQMGPGCKVLPCPGPRPAWKS